MKVFFNQNMSVDSGGFSPSGNKPAAAVADWLAHGLAIKVCDFEPVTVDDLCLAHDRDFVLEGLSGRRPNGHGNTLPDVTNACLWTCGSMLAASRQALVDGISCSPSSGFHHAQYSRNGGFCTFNGLIVAAEKLKAERLVNNTGILDCDAHYGNGSDNIIEKLGLQDHVLHWTFGGVYTVETFDQSDLIARMGDALKMMKRKGAELILYQAGADPHENDELGGFQTTEEMRARDQFVFEMCRTLNLPVAFCLAGGYQRDAEGKIDAVLDLHRATIVEALRVSAARRN